MLNKIWKSYIYERFSRDLCLSRYKNNKAYKYIFELLI